MEKKYTKGKWEWNFVCGNYYAITSPEGIVLEPFGNSHGGSTLEISEGDAHLIVAAPDLLEAGEEQVEVIKRCQLLIVAYLKPDGLKKDQFINEIIDALDGPEQRKAQSAWDAAIRKACGEGV